MKIPRWLRQYVGGDLQIDISSGRDYPNDLKNYKLILHCGGCMMNRVLSDLLVPSLVHRRLRVLVAAKVPAGDGGLSLGQAHMGRLSSCA